MSFLVLSAPATPRAEQLKSLMIVLPWDIIFLLGWNYRSENDRSEPCKIFPYCLLNCIRCASPLVELEIIHS